jgi:7-cyano-7-deazaguanine synthase
MFHVSSVSVLVKAKDNLLAPDQNRSPDQVRLLHHEVDGFLLRPGERPGLEHGAAGAYEVEKVVRLDVVLEELARGRLAIDVALLDLDPLLLQKTSGVAAGGSGRLPVEGRLGHRRHTTMFRMSRAVVLLSGGLDSYTAGAIVRARGDELYALTVRYGQVHAQELRAAERVARALAIVRRLEISVNLDAMGGSALLGEGPVPTDRPLDRSEIPSTYVPARNTIFLSLALGWAEVVGADTIVIGANAVDYSGYPDCRPEYLEAFERLARLATRAGVEGRTIRVEAPLLRMSKADIIRAGSALGLDYALTHSCYRPDAGGMPCLRCDSCRLRARGFDEAGIPDPLLARARAH